MRVALLGPLEVDTDGGPVLVAAAKERAVLMALALRNRSEVTTDELIDALWGDRPPKTARKAVQTYITNLRRLLPPGSVITTHAGYSLQADDVDAIEFELLLVRSRSLATTGTDAAAIAKLFDALALWRGPPLTDLADHQIGAVAIARLEELCRTAEEELADLRLSAGEHEALVASLEAAVAVEPLREHRWAQLMLALYRSGRQAEALRAYQRLRDHLGEELGLEPGEELAALEDAILAQKPELRWMPRVPLVERDQPSPDRRQVRATRLAVAANSFIGRDQECAAIAALLDRVRLVSVVGPGGCGKTRVAVEVANRQSGRFADGVTLVALADIAPSASGDAVERQVAAAVRVTEEPDQPVLTTVLAALNDREILLVMDNCEHLVADAARVAEALVSTCRHLTVLTTSRESLRCPSEHRFPLHPLPAPAAAELFTDRARAASPDTAFEAEPALIARVCHQLDGLPLALEIAAARLETCTPSELAAGLSDRFGLLTGGARTADDRHRTLRAAIDWSYRLLDDSEQSLLRSMGVFHGGATPTEVLAVCGPDDPMSLIQKSLVLRTPGPDSSRLAMHETIRHFALDRLEHAGEAGSARRRHAEAYTALAESSAALVRGPNQAQTIARLNAEKANLDGALTWARDSGSWQIMIRMGVALWWYWFRSDQAAAGLAWLQEATRSAPDDHPEADGAAAYLSWALDDFIAATTYAERVVRSPHTPACARALALGVLARIHGDKGESGPARSAALESERLYLADGDSWTVAWARRCRASAALYGGDPDPEEARALTNDAIRGFRQVGDDWAVAGCLNLLAGIAARSGDHHAAFELAQESVACHRRFDDFSGLRWSLFHLAGVARQVGDAAAAVRAATESLQLATDHGFRMGAMHAHLLLAELGAGSSDAKHHARQAAELARQLDDQPGLAAASSMLAASDRLAGR